ncbi:PilZ domain-containing protein [Rhodoplanes serenus]|jgi:hypothetical protein|uniref:PilZ domain-containing protein n=1 Tax=Rhodoplanes serenus TaxID=200615 RepID=A0A327JZ23_9BRAD|nr:PilZ domain-containing protein [Rhodoplanes serenus]RAI30844.1 hypothetical protein CH340_20370 [Rhodoplanes serenus]
MAHRERSFAQTTSVPVERRRDIRVVVNLPGRYVLPRRRAVDGKPPAFACRLVNASPHGLMVAASVVGAVGEPVAAQFEEFGRLDGVILRRLYGGFAMSIEVSGERLAQLEAKLVWLDQHQRKAVANERRHDRMVPRTPHSIVVLADGTTLPCRIIDMSASGAAVTAALTPPLGMPLAVGAVVGRVVRRFAGGFAVEFVETQEIATLERLLIRSPVRARAMSAMPPPEDGGEIVIIDA